jgi:hypothetical protein
MGLELAEGRSVLEAPQQRCNILQVAVALSDTVVFGDGPRLIRSGRQHRQATAYQKMPKDGDAANSLLVLSNDCIPKQMFR